MSYQKLVVPEQGARIEVNSDGSLKVPQNPIIPFITGDGIGVDISPVMKKVVDAAVTKAQVESEEAVANEKAAESKAIADDAQRASGRRTPGGTAGNV